MHPVQLARHPAPAADDVGRALYHRRDAGPRRDGLAHGTDCRVDHACAGRPVLDNLMMNQLKSEQGTTLIETMIALCVLLVVMSGLITISAMSSTTTENNGHLAARTTEDAQDKMEQLLVLAYTDANTDTSVFPATPA